MRLATLGALGALVFFCRAWLIRVGGSPLPFWDQWDAEATRLYLPWITGTFHWADIFQAHNEHRIALTQLANLVLFEGNGGWNPWMQLLLNAALHAGSAVVLTAIFWSALTSRSRIAFVVGLAVLFTATAGWQNALWGFQSQVYFGSLLAIAAFAGLFTQPPFGTRWWLGLAAALLALVAYAGGVFVAVAAAIASVVFQPGIARPARWWLAPVMLLGVAAIGFALQGQAPHHAYLRARSFGEFWAVFTRCLAWPHVDRGWLCLIMQLPLASLLFLRWRRREEFTPADRAAFALALFSGLTAAAVAYGRAAGLPDARPLSRYQDPLLLGAAAQLFAMLQLATLLPRGRLAALLWCGSAMAGLLALTETNLTRNLPYKRANDRASLAFVHTYLATGDATLFTRDATARAMHPSDPLAVKRIMDNTELRPFLPRELREPPTGAPFLFPWPIAHAAGLTAIAGFFLLACLCVPARKPTA